MKKFKLILSEENKKLLNIGNKVSDDSESYYQLPFYFRQNEDGTFSQLTFSELPNKVQDSFIGLEAK